MNDDSSDEENESTSKKSSNEHYADVNEGNRVESIIGALKSMNISQDILQSAHAPKSKATLKETLPPEIPSTQNQPVMPDAMNTMPGSMNTMPGSMPGSMNPMPGSMNSMPGSMNPMPGSMNTMPGSINNMQAPMMQSPSQMPFLPPEHQPGNPPPPNSLYTLPSQI